MKYSKSFIENSLQVYKFKDYFADIRIEILKTEIISREKRATNPTALQLTNDSLLTMSKNHPQSRLSK